MWKQQNYLNCHKKLGFEWLAESNIEIFNNKINKYPVLPDIVILNCI